MTVVADHWVDPISGPVPRALVTAHLRTDSINTDAPGFDSVGLRAVIPDVSVMTGDDGSWSLDLVPNTNFDLLAPGSYYEVTLELGDLTLGPILIEVPAAAGPFRLDQIPAGSTTAAFMPPVLHAVPRLFVGDAPGTYTEVNYGAQEQPGDIERGLYAAGNAYAVGDITLDATNATRYRCITAGTGHLPSSSPTYWARLAVLDCKYELTPSTCRATYMLRMGDGATMAPTGKFFALELVVPAAMDLGDGIAEIVGVVTIGINTLNHKLANVHLGRIGDGLNPDYCYFVATDTLVVANNSFAKGNTDWLDFHAKLEWWRA